MFHLHYRTSETFKIHLLTVKLLKISANGQELTLKNA